MIRLHSTLGSINGYKVRLLLALLDQPYELVELDMYAGEHKKEPFLTLNPFGQMPALTDGDYTIADSHACLVYVARKYDPSNQWLPADAEGEAKVAEWLSKSAKTSLMPAPLMSIWYSACTAARGAAPRRLAFRPGAFAALFLPSAMISSSPDGA